MRLPSRAPHRRFAAVAGGVALAALAVWAGHWRLRELRRDAYLEWERLLSGNAAVTRAGIEEWLAERIDDVADVAYDAAAHLEWHGRAPTRLDHSDRMHGRLVQALTSSQRAHGYKAAWAFDDTGTPVAEADGSEPPTEEELAAVQRAMRLRDLALAGPTRLASGRIGLTFALPVYEPRRGRSGERRVIGAAAMRLDPGRSLFPIVSRQPFPIPTSESGLLMRVGDTVVIITPRLSTGDSALSVRVPWRPDRQIAGQLALEGQVTFGAFVNADGLATLAATQHIPRTGWGLVRRITQRQAYAAAHRHFLMEVLATLAILGALGLGLAALNRHTRVVQLRLVADSEARLAAIIGSAMDAIVTVDDAQRITLFNPAAERLFGRAAADVVGTELLALLPPRHHAAYLAAVRLLDEAELLSIALDAAHDLHGVRGDGAEFPVEGALSRFTVGGRRAYTVVLRDVTMRKQVEGALHESERRFRATLENVQLIAVTMDTWGTITFCNDSLLKLTGWKHADVIGRNWFDLLVADGALLKALFHDRVMDGTLPAHQEHEIRTRDGARRRVALDTTILRDPQGQAIGTASIGQDVTERARAEEARLRYTRELVRSNEELERFAYVASHDLQEPLQAIAGHARTLEARYGERLDTEGGALLAALSAGAARLQRMITDVVAYARIDSHGGSIIPTDAAEAFSRAVERLSPAIAARAATITCTPLPSVAADPAQLAMLLEQLLDNAIKFHGSLPPMVHVSADRRDGGWVFAVRDNGIGIAPEDSERIFGIFGQLHSRAEYPGTGIGLATCKRIVERHGGRLWVESAPGVGATFYFTLPSMVPAATSYPTPSRGTPAQV